MGGQGPRVAFELVDADPELERQPLLAGEVALFLGDDEADFLLVVGPIR